MIEQEPPVHKNGRVRSIIIRVCILAVLIAGTVQVIGSGWLSQQLSMLLLQPSNDSLQFKANSTCNVQIATKTKCITTSTGDTIDTVLRMRVQPGQFINGRNGLPLSLTVGKIYVQPNGRLYSQTPGNITLNDSSQIICNLQKAGTCSIPTLPYGFNTLSDSTGEHTTIWKGKQTGVGNIQLATGLKSSDKGYVVVPILWINGRVVPHLPTHVLSAVGSLLATGAPLKLERQRATEVGEGIIVILVAIECLILSRSIGSDIRLWHGLPPANKVPKNRNGHWVEALEAEHMQELVERTFGNATPLPRVMAWNLDRRQPAGSPCPGFILRHIDQVLPPGALVWVPTMRQHVLWSARAKRDPQDAVMN